MKDTPHKLPFRINLPIFIILFTGLVLLILQPAQAFNLPQTIQPQKVYAIYSGPAFPEGIPPEANCTADVDLELNLEVWNVGSEAGSQYGEARLIWKTPHLISPPPYENNCEWSGFDEMEFTGTFSGGPNGVVRIPFSSGCVSATGGNELELTFSNGLEVTMPYIFNCLYTYSSGDENTASINLGTYLLKVQNPEAFEATGTACLAHIILPSGITPGQIFSPGVDFTGSDGKPLTTPLQPRWYINGVQTNSIIWDGAPLNIELQYTCPDNVLHSEFAQVPAYEVGQPPGSLTGQSNPPPDQPLQPPGQSGQPVDISGQPPADAQTGLTSSEASKPTISSEDQRKVIGSGALVVAGIVGGAVSILISLINILSKPSVAPIKIPTTTPRASTLAKTAAASSQSGRLQQVPAKPGNPPPEYQKDVLDATGEAASGYLKGVGNVIDGTKEFTDTIKNSDLKDETKKTILKPTEKYIQKPLERGKKTVDTIKKPLDQLKKARETARRIEKHREQNRKFGEEMEKDLQNMPDGTKNQIRDLSQAIDGAGRALGEGLKHVPGYEYTGGEKTWEVQKSFNEAARGTEKALKTVHRSDSEMKELGLEKEFQDKQSIYDDPAYQDLQRELKNQQPQEPGWFSRAWDALVGKKSDPSVIRNR